MVFEEEPSGIRYGPEQRRARLRARSRLQGTKEMKGQGRCAGKAVTAWHRDGELGGSRRCG